MTAIPRLDVDAALCISLVERDDRRPVLLSEMAPLGLAVEFILVERDRDNPERGCYHSHLRCAELALQRGYRRVLILEDDATLEHFEPGQIAHINRFLRWRQPELFYLGGILGRMWRIPFPGVVRCRLSCAHAYILSAAGCRRILSLPFAGDPVDSIYARHFTAYGAYPMLCQQQPECRVVSDLARHRRERPDGDMQVKDAEFWRHNWEKQRQSVRRHWGRTLSMRWF